MALVGNILLGTGAAPGMSSIASAYAESAASSNIPWSALEYSGQTITAISGSAIGGQGGGGDTSQCMPISGMTAYQTVSSMTAYQTVSSISSWTADMSAISSKQDKLTFGYSGEYISSINGSAIIDTQGGGGVTPEEVSAIASAYADDKLDKTASSTFQPSGNYAYQSSVSSKLDASASSNFAPAGNYAYQSSLSSYLSKSASSDFAPAGDYAYNSSLSGKLDNSASSTWYPKTGNPSGFLTAHQSLTGYTPKSAISSQSSVWNTVTGKVNVSDISGRSATWNTVSAMVPKSAISAQSATWNTVTAKADATAVHTYTGVSPVVVNNTTNQISLSASSIHLDTSLRSYVSGTSGFIGMAYPMQFVSNSSQATGSNILYVVLGG